MNRQTAKIQRLKIYVSDSTCAQCHTINAKRYTSTGACWHCLTYRKRIKPMSERASSIHEQIWLDFCMVSGVDAKTSYKSHWVKPSVYSTIAKRYEAHQEPRALTPRQEAISYNLPTYEAPKPCIKCYTFERRTDSGACIQCLYLKRLEKEFSKPI